MYPKLIQSLIEKFSRFPTVGPRTAARFVFYLLKAKNKEVEELTSLIQRLKNEINFCDLCFKTVEKEGLCEICSDASRSKLLLCVVEKEQDLEAIESTGKYTGLYFIIGGRVSRLNKKDVENLRMEELKERIKKGAFKEIILALNPTIEGEATALYIERELKSFLAGQDKKITRLGRGLPVGGEMEYADEETLSSALDNRR